MLRKSFFVLSTLLAFALLIGFQASSQAQIIPGQVTAKGSVRALDGVSSINFNVNVQWKNSGVVAGSTFNVFTYGAGLPAINVSGPVTSVQIDATATSAVVIGTAMVNGQATQVEFHVTKGTGIYTPNPYGTMGVSITGGLTFASPNFPTELLIYSGGVQIRKPF